MLFLSRKSFSLAVILIFTIFSTASCSDSKANSVAQMQKTADKKDTKKEGFDEMYEAFYGDPNKLPDDSEVKGMGKLLQGATKKFYGDKNKKKTLTRKNKKSTRTAKADSSKKEGFDEMYEAFYGDPDKLPDDSKVKGMGKLLQGATETLYGDKK